MNLKKGYIGDLAKTQASLFFIGNLVELTPIMS